MSWNFTFAARATRTALISITLLSVASAQDRNYPQPVSRTETIAVHALPRWSSFDLEVRERAEGQTAMNYTAGNGNSYDLGRIRGGLTVAPLGWMNTYIQFQDSHAWALPLSLTASNMRDTFDFRQAYLRLHVKEAEVLAGRQELRFGGERLVGVSDWTNVSRTFDGVAGKFGSRNNVTLFTSSVVVIHAASLDMHAAGLSFHGVYGSIESWVPHTKLEPYVFVKALPRVLSQQSIFGTETEVVPGMRVIGNLPKHFDYTMEGALERGSFSNNSIHAGAGYAKLSYTAPLGWTPRLLGEYDYATGNPQRNAMRIGTFDQLYPSAHNVFGLEDFFGWQNIKEVRLSMDLNPTRHLTLLFQQEFLNAANTRDSIYTGSGSVLIKHPSAGFGSDQIGNGFDMSSKYVIRNDLMLNSGVAHFFPGTLMTANGHGAAATIAYAGLTYRVKGSRTEAEAR